MRPRPWPRSQSLATWVDIAVAFAGAQPVLGNLRDILLAFAEAWPRGGQTPRPEDSWHGEFEALEVASLGRAEAPALVEDLTVEVDAAQAAMFGRRFRAVDEVLAGLDHPEARVLRLGLHRRLDGMLAAPRPRALRVRALADFYYSQAGRLMHALRPGHFPTVAELIPDLCWHEVGAGVWHAHLEAVTTEGPVHANLLRCDPGAVELEVRDCREAVERGEPFDAYVRRSRALAAVSGGFFLYSEADIAPPSRRFDPVGLLASGGEVHSPPAFRRGSLVVEAAGQISLRRVGWDDCTALLGGVELQMSRAVNRAAATHGPDKDSIAVVGHAVVATGRRLPVPLNGFVVPVNPGSQATVGARVQFLPSFHAGVAGGPMLVIDGEPVMDHRAEDFWGTAPPVTFSQDETGDHNQLPRLAAGTTANGTLIFAAIDGRHFERAAGMTLAQSGALLQALGCTNVVNLDGGSSKRMVVDGAIVDLPSTEMETSAGATGGVRPVHTCVLIRSRLA